LAAINDLYQNEWRQMMNLFQPSVKLLRKKRVGSRLRRQYDAARAPLDRLIESQHDEAAQIQALLQLRRDGDPFALGAKIESKVRNVWDLANDKQTPHVKRKAG
jgi:hypothetical protein